MDSETIKGLNIGDLNSKIPIIQGGMGVGVSMSGLASAVANEGGIGIIAAAGIGMHEPDFVSNFREANRRALRKEIRKAKQMTKGIIGVNVMLALSDFAEYIMIAVEEGADVVILGAGLPLKDFATVNFEKIKKVSTKIIPVVSSARAANIIFQFWANNYKHVPDAIILEGPMAGGHLGYKKDQIDDPEYSLDHLLPQVVEVAEKFSKQFNKNIPVIAAGGIFTGEDIYKYMKMGAQGVQMATRFVATHECDASMQFKNAYLNCQKEDLVIIDSPLGLAGRAIRNKFIDDVTAGMEKPFMCPWKCLIPCDFRNVPYCIAYALTNAKMGKLDEGFAFAGANAYLVDKIVSVKELINTLILEYKNASLKKFILPKLGLVL